MRWHELRLTTDGAWMGARMWQLLWEASVAGERSDDGNAIFLASHQGGSVTLYFPPSAQLLATAVGAGCCGKPDLAELTLLAGPDSAWFVHFGTGDAARPRAYLAGNTRSA